MPIDWFPLCLRLRVAGFPPSTSLAISLSVAYLLASREWRGKEILDAVTTLPLVLPPTVLGYYLLVLIGRESALGRFYEWVFGAPLVFAWQAATLAALFHSTPLLIKFTRAAFESIAPTFEPAAANPVGSVCKVFGRVTVPLPRRSIFAAPALAFARSLGDFGITIMIAGNIPDRTQTIAVAIYAAVESRNGALARALVL